MAEDQELVCMIQDAIYRGYGLVRIFRIMCNLLKIYTDDEDDIVEFSEDGDLKFSQYMSSEQKSKITAEHEVLIKQINKYHMKVERGWYSRACQANRWVCNLHMLSERYGIERKYKGGYPEFHKLVLFDNLYGEWREIPTDSFEIPHECYKLEVIDQTRILLIFRSKISQHLRTLFLLKIDVQSNKTELLGTQEMNIPYYVSIIFDSKNRNRFIICPHHEKYEVVPHPSVEIVGKKLEFGEAYITNTHFIEFSSIRMEGNKIHVLSDFYILPIVMYEINIVSNQFQRKRLCEVPSDLTEKLRSSRSCFVWTEQSMYIICDVVDDPQFSQLYRFELSTKTFTQIDCKMPPYVKYAVVDNDEILSVCLSGYDQHVGFRIPLRKPDQLINLATFALRRQLFFFDQQQYDAFMLQHQIPSTLLPFGK